MRICKPDYYDEFNCIAADCDFTCCQDWTIAVDDLTLQKWKNLEVPEGMQSDGSHLSDFTLQEMECSHLKLGEDGKCLFLNQEGLCRIVLKHGEETLSHTCHTFPRERHEFADRVEYALSLGCKNVLDHLWKKDFFQVISAESTDETVDQGASETPELQFMIRDWFMKIAANKEIPVKKTLKILFYLILDLYEKSEQDLLTEETFLAYRDSDILRQLDTAIQDSRETLPDTFYEDNELFLDLAENYRKKRIYTKYLEPIAQRAEHYEQKYDLNKLEDKIDRFSVVWSQYETKMRTLVCEELYAAGLLPNSELYCMVMKLEWLAIEYAVIRQWMFLQWDMTGEVTYDDLKRAVSVIFRMTGYSDEDIEEYLDNSFESVIWDYGYMALIL